MEDDPDHLLPRWLEAIMRQRTRKRMSSGPSDGGQSMTGQAMRLMHSG